MANAYRSGNGEKVFNRDIHLSPGCSQKQNGAYITTTVQKTCVANAECIDQNIFVANRRWRVVGISEVHTTAGSDGSAVSVQVKKCSGTTVPASGTALQTAAFDAKGTAQTVQSATLASDSICTIEAGERLALDFTGTITALAGVCVSVDLIPA
jgi:hypothetical protein